LAEGFGLVEFALFPVGVELGHEAGGGGVGDGPEGDEDAGDSGGNERSRQPNYPIPGEFALAGVAGTEDDEVGFEFEVEDVIGGE
jgi:hypothetical protein